MFPISFAELMAFSVNSIVRLVTMVAALTTILSVGRIGAQETPESLFQQGKAAIERNCGDCAGQSKQGMEEGVHKVEQAFGLAFQNARIR